MTNRHELPLPLRRIPAEKLRRYRASDACVFWTTSAEFGEFSNMATGFPVKVMGREFSSSEALYQACKYPDAPNVQEEIRRAATPKAAKLVSRRYSHLARGNWLAIRTKVMRWVLRIKGSQHKKQMLFTLIQTGSKDIVERSTRDGFWGAMQVEDELIGMNVLGRLLMELREDAFNANINLMEIAPPAIEKFRLFERDVGVSPSQFPDR